jgi:NAD(P)-dependent dehydrogenase (short-subunit alcohol dehydrogenase family)
MNDRKNFLITGATGGLGSTVACHLRQSGAKVFLFGRDPIKLTGVMKEGDEPHVMPTIQERLLALIRVITKDFPLHGILHAAGEERLMPLRMETEDGYMRVHQSTLIAHTLLRAAASKGVMAPDSSVVLMSSVAAHRGVAGMSSYCASKAAIEALARCAAVELAPKGIRVNCVAAGAFESPMHDRVVGPMDDEAVERYKSTHPLGFGSTEDVAQAVLFLLRPQSSWVTGSTMAVDGGYLAR